MKFESVGTHVPKGVKEVSSTPEGTFIRIFNPSMIWTTILLGVLWFLGLMFILIGFGTTAPIIIPILGLSLVIGIPYLLFKKMTFVHKINITPQAIIINNKNYDPANWGGFIMDKTISQKVKDSTLNLGTIGFYYGGNMVETSITVDQNYHAPTVNYLNDTVAKYFNSNDAPTPEESGVREQKF